MKILFVLLVSALSLQAQSKYIRVADSINEMIASNPAQIHTNVFVVGKGFYTFYAGNADATNALYCLGTTSTNTPGRYKLGPMFGSTNTFTTVVSSNIYVTNLYVTNITVSGSATIPSLLSGSFQQLGTGTDANFNAQDTWQKMDFAGVGPGFILTNAGTYQITYTLANDSGGSNQNIFYLTNVTDHVFVSGTLHGVNLSSAQQDQVLNWSVLITTAASNKTYELWGRSTEAGYATSSLLATNTVLNVLRLQ